jgi:hypothetical protein
MLDESTMEERMDRYCKYNNAIHLCIEQDTKYSPYILFKAETEEQRDGI